jgi:hypothetical protein
MPRIVPRAKLAGGPMEILTPEGASYSYGSSSSDAAGDGGAFCFVGDFCGSGLVGAPAVCGTLGCFLEGGLLTVRYLRIFSSFFGPMPLMARRSSTLLNAPYDLRVSRIFCAVEGPMPGTCCSSVAPAVLILTGCAGGFFLASAAGDSARQKTRTVRNACGTECQRPNMP